MMNSLSVLLVLLVVLVVQVLSEYCMTIQQRCMSQLGCSIALGNYMVSCGPVIDGEVRQCTRECRLALLQLLSMDHGETFMTCDCGRNDMCEEQKHRIAVCHQEVLHALPSVTDDTSIISCTLAQLVCSADTSCYTALNYYDRHCQKLFRGEKCTVKCNNSLSILYSQRKAHKLRMCICDGSELYNCQELRDNTASLCHDAPFHRHRSSTVAPAIDSTPHIRHHHPHTRTPVNYRTPSYSTPSPSSSNGGGVNKWENTVYDKENSVTHKNTANKCSQPTGLLLMLGWLYSGGFIIALHFGTNLLKYTSLLTLQITSHLHR